MTNEITRERWKTRRAMAWYCLCGIAAVLPLTMFMSVKWLTAASGIIIALIGFASVIIMVYIRDATKDDIANK